MSAHSCMSTALLRRRSGGLPAQASGAIDSRSARSFGRLFCACGSRPFSARTVHCVGGLRRFRDALSPSASLAAYRFTCLGKLTELLPWPCPLTLLENWLKAKADVQPYQEGFLLHYLDKLVYPDISATVLTVAGVLVCALNLALYARQMWIVRSR